MKSHIKNKDLVLGTSRASGDLSQISTTFAKNYLYNLYNGKIKSADLKIKRIEGIQNHFDSYVGKPHVNFNKQCNLYQFFDLFMICNAEYLNEEYSICFKTVFRQDQTIRFIFQHNQIFITGTSKNASRSLDLKSYIEKQAVVNSSIQHQVIQLQKTNRYDTDLLSISKLINIPSVELDKIFIQNSKKEQIKRFNYSVNNFDRDRLSLRYLFNGKPGTGKTQIINSILNATKGRATVFIMHSGGGVALSEAIEYCSLFEPAILVIDDLDLLSLDRVENSDKSNLSSILQFLDGIIPNNIFILAATNDKKLVDEASRRPGRFDVIIDVSEIDPEHYLSLIKRETDDERILRLFDDEKLYLLKTKNVTGAFLVSFIKQIKSAIILKGDFTEIDYNDYFNLIYKGFYDYNDEHYSKAVGFMK